jgi:predicted RNA-binding Zn-ribbon protein involved in translation (DUF1610 family)
MSYSHHLCPRCGASLDRVHRRLLDRLISRVYRVHRYACTSTACGWKGLLHRSRGRKPFMASKTTIWIAIVVISLASALTVILCLM